MPTDYDWISTRVTKAREQHPSVTDAVSDLMAGLLKGELSERQISKLDLTKLAKELIMAMASTSPEKDAKQ